MKQSRNVESDRDQIKKRPDFDLNSLKKFPSTQSASGVCIGRRGINFLPGRENYMGIYTDNQNMSLYDLVSGKMVRSISHFAGEAQTHWNSMDFSPNGGLFLLTSQTKKTISIYRVKDFLKISEWNRNKSRKGSIEFCKWLDDKRIMATFENPGNLEVFEIGKKNPVISVIPNASVSGFINYAALCPSKTAVICGAGQRDRYPIFKIRLEDQNQKEDWIHFEHTLSPRIIVLSHCGLYVFSSGRDNRIILTKEQSGEVLFNSRIFRDIVENIWVFPDSKSVFVQSWNEVKLLHWERGPGDKTHRLMEGAGLHKNSIEWCNIWSANVFWDKSPKRKHKVVIGLSSGSIYTMDLV